jgi:hypothetical protein
LTVCIRPTLGRDQGQARVNMEINYLSAWKTRDCQTSFVIIRFSIAVIRGSCVSSTEDYCYYRHHQHHALFPILELHCHVTANITTFVVLWGSCFQLLPILHQVVSAPYRSTDPTALWDSVLAFSALRLTESTVPPQTNAARRFLAHYRSTEPHCTMRFCPCIQRLAPSCIHCTTIDKRCTPRLSSHWDSVHLMLCGQVKITYRGETCCFKPAP